MQELEVYLNSIKKQFHYYKQIGDKTFEQLPEEALFWKCNEDSNSIAIIVSHMNGNMLSRWTDFLTTDGEKTWRDRDKEFEETIYNKKELLEKWESGWKCFLNALDSLTEKDLLKTILIRNERHTVLEAINRQLAHYPYHVGQIVWIGKMHATHWNSLSIPKGRSQQFNQDMFDKTSST